MSELRRRGRRSTSDVYTKNAIRLRVYFFSFGGREETDRKGATEREATATFVIFITAKIAGATEAIAYRARLGSAHSSRQERRN